MNDNCLVVGCFNNIYTKKMCKFHYNKDYYSKNKANVLAQKKQYNFDHKNDKKEYDKLYRTNNKEKILKEKYTYYNNRIKFDPIFKIRVSVSRAVGGFLKSHNSSKGNKSILLYLEYSIDKLKEHLESLFEPWMNWSNWGKYNSKTWNDNDQSTWTWNIDHIIPQSKLPYRSMEEDNFKKCWSLDNLRPYSAKQNSIDGATKIRHD